MKILVLTSIYPQPDDEKNSGVTPVVHYFTKEWVKNGHEVFVIHNSNKFLFFLYLIPNFIKQKINSLLGIVVPNINQRKKLYRISDGVKIKRIPILKLIPKRDFLKYQINKQFKKIKKTLKEENFKPDLIIGHWEAPQIQLVSMLKDYYNTRSAIVLHGINYLNEKKYLTKNREHVENIDVFGGRSEEIAKYIKDLVKLEYEPFVCYSGIPDKFIRQNTISYTEKRFGDGAINEFLYVGRLIERKNIDTIIKALRIANKSDNFTLNIIGTGACEVELKKLSYNLGLKNNINFRGYTSRDKVINYMRDAQCFTMVSRDEVFGLVYLEAMSQGCIVIAAKGEGFDGIIADEENGFLCEAGNEKELARIYKKINSLSKSEKEYISQNAIKTAHSLTESKVAKIYLENVIRKSN